MAGGLFLFRELDYRLMSKQEGMSLRKFYIAGWVNSCLFRRAILAKIDSGLMEKAKQGDAQTQHNLATFYEQGKGVTRDGKKRFTVFTSPPCRGFGHLRQVFLTCILTAGAGPKRT